MDVVGVPPEKVDDVGPVHREPAVEAPLIGERSQAPVPPPRDVGPAIIREGRPGRFDAPARRVHRCCRRAPLVAERTTSQAHIVRACVLAGQRIEPERGERPAMTRDDGGDRPGACARIVGGGLVLLLHEREPVRYARTAGEHRPEKELERGEQRQGLVEPPHGVERRSAEHRGAMCRVEIGDQAACVKAGRRRSPGLASHTADDPARGHERWRRIGEHQVRRQPRETPVELISGLQARQQRSARASHARVPRGAWRVGGGLDQGKLPMAGERVEPGTHRRWCRPVGDQHHACSAGVLPLDRPNRVEEPMRQAAAPRHEPDPRCHRRPPGIRSSNALSGAVRRQLADERSAATSRASDSACSRARPTQSTSRTLRSRTDISSASCSATRDLVVDPVPALRCRVHACQSALPGRQAPPAGAREMSRRAPAATAAGRRPRQRHRHQYRAAEGGRLDLRCGCEAALRGR